MTDKVLDGILSGYFEALMSTPRLAINEDFNSSLNLKCIENYQLKDIQGEFVIKSTLQVNT